MNDLIAIDACERRVAVAGAQVQRITGKGANRQGELELRARIGVEIGALQELRDRLPAPQDLGFLIAGAQDVCGRASSQREEQSQKTKLICRSTKK